MADARRDRREGFAAPLVIIALGGLLLLSTMGELPTGFWPELIGYWPVLIILAGVELLFGKGLAGRLLSGAVTLVVIVGVVWLAWGQAGSDDVSRRAYSFSTEAVDRLTVDAEFGVGQLEIRAGEAGRIDVIVRSGGGPEAEFEVEDGEGVLELTRDAPRLFFLGQNMSDNVTLELPPGVPLDLNVDTGVGDVNVDATDLRLNTLDYSAGVGDSLIRFPGAGPISASVDGGIGAIRIEVPESLPARIVSDTGLAQARFDRRFGAVGDARETSDYTREAGLRLEIDLGIGDVRVDSVAD